MQEGEDGLTNGLVLAQASISGDDEEEKKELPSDPIAENDLNLLEDTL